MNLFVRIALLEFLITFAIFPQNTSWTQYARVCGGSSGKIPSVTSKGMMVLDSYWGLFTTTDQGVSWDEQPAPATPTAIDVTNDTTWIIGTGTEGVYKSNDSGKTWIKANTGLTDPWIRTILRRNQKDIFVGGNEKGVFRSTDNGDHWQQVNTGINDPWIMVTSLTAHPSGRLYATSYNSGLYCSDNSGDSWTKVSDAVIGFVHSTVFIDHHGYIYVANMKGDVYRSIDNGKTWNWIMAYGYVKSIVVDKSNTIYASGDQLYISKDGGAHWNGLGLPSGGFLLCMDHNDNLFGYAYNLGWCKLSLGEQTWRPCNVGYGTTSINSILFDQAQVLMFTSEQYGIHRADKTGVLRQKDNGLKSPGVFSLASTRLKTLLAGTPLGVFRSMDAMQSWIPSGLTNNPVRCFAQDENGDALAGTDWGGIYRSTDDGITWTLMNGGMNSAGISNIVVSKSGTIAFTTTDGKLWTTQDHGATWNLGNCPLNHSGFRLLAADSIGNLYVTDSLGQVFRIIQDINWSLFASLKGTRSMIVDGKNNVIVSDLNRLTVFNKAGVPFTLPGNASPMFSLSLDQSGHLWGSDKWGTLFTLNYITTTLNVDIKSVPPNHVELYQNYPNPFNPSTNIRCSLPGNSEATLEIFDVLGKKITTVFHGALSSGSHTFLWNGLDEHGTPVPSGLYSYRLRSKDFVQTKKMLFLK